MNKKPSRTENDSSFETIEKIKSAFDFGPSKVIGFFIAKKKPINAKGNAKMVWLNFIRDK